MAVTAIRNPKVTLNLVSRDQTVGLEDYRVLLVGQMLSGTAAAGLVPDLPRTAGEINALFGARSHLAAMARKFREINPYTEVDCIALADATGTNATAKVVSTGTATEAKTVYFDVVSSQYHSYEVDIEVGDTPALLSAKILAKIALDTTCPFTAAASMTTVTDDTVTFTSVHDGTISNAWLVRSHDAYGNGLTGVAGLTWTWTGWASGATDPTLTSILDPVENIRYHAIVWPQAYATTVAKSFINARFNLDNDIKDGVVYQWVADSFANVKTAAAAMNSPSFAMLTNETMAASYWKGPHLPEMPDVLAVTFVASEARRFEDDISISDLVVTNEPLDQFGGRHTASLPYFNTPFLNVGVPDRGAGYTYAEQLELEEAGVSVIGANVRHNGIISSVMVTTYLNDGAGNDDDTWHFLNWRRTHSVIREFFVNNLREDFAQHRLTSGSVVAGYAIANEALIRAVCGGYYDLLADEVLTVKGREARKYFDEHLAVTITQAERKVEIAADVPMMSQLGIINGSIKFSFDV